MKKLISLGVSGLSLFLLSALNGAAEFVVLGVDAECPVPEALAKYEKLGFKRVADSDSSVRGEFRGHPIVLQLHVDKTTGNTGLIAAYITHTPGKFYDSWSVLKGDLVEVTAKLKEQYKVECAESFDFKSPHKEGDGHEFDSICQGEANVFTALFPKADGILYIKLYPSTISTDRMMIIMQIGSDHMGLKTP